MSDANQVALKFWEETPTFGIETGAPKMKLLRFTNETLEQATNSTTSQEIRSDRNIPDTIRIGINASGDINGEWSHNAYDDFIVAALCSSGWSTALQQTGISCAVDGTLQKYTGTGMTVFAVGQWIAVTGYTTAANNGYRRVKASSTTNLEVEYGYEDLVTETAKTCTITQGPYIDNGTTFTSYRIEKEFKDNTTDFAVYYGMVIGSWTLNVSTDGVLTTSFSFNGIKEVSKTVTQGDGSPTAAPTEDVANSIDNVYAVITNPTTGTKVDVDISELSITVNNNTRNKLKIGNLGPFDIGLGNCQVSGNMTIYYEDATLVSKYLGWLPVHVYIVITNTQATPIGYLIELPDTKLTKAPRNAGGINTDVMVPMNFSSELDSTRTLTVKISKVDQGP